MKLLIVISCLATVQAGVTKRDACDGPLIDEVYHTKETLKTGIDRPYLLSCDRTTNTLYFSYSVTPEDDGFKAAKINLSTREVTDINGVNNGFASSVDRNTGDAYIGGRDRIYKCNKGSNKAEYYGANGTDVWVVFFKDKLYYAEYPSQFMYTIENETVSRLYELEDTKVDNFVIDNDNYIYFSNHSGLYSQKLGQKDAVFFENSADISIRGLAVDVNGKVYVCISNGIYLVKKQEHILKKYLDVDDAFGVEFDDNNNLIYSDTTSIVRVRPTKYEECV